MSKECFATEIAGFKIRLDQQGPDRFSVLYGQQYNCHLTYAEAAAELGRSIMHALACEGKLDNS